MATVDPASQLAALIRAQVTSVRATRRTSVAGVPGASDAAASRAHHNRREPPANEDLSSIVAARIRSIGADDPQRGRKALRMFLEVVVLSELGQNIANDPKFAVMLDHIETQMHADAQLAEASQQAAEFLLQAADTAQR